MASLNTKRKASRSKILNHEGAVGYELSALENIFSKTLGSFFGESTFYENRDAKEAFNNLVELIKNVNEKDKEYVLKIAELGRKNNMISYPLEILTACYNLDRYKGHNFLDPETGKSKLAYYSDIVIRRALDITEVLATQKAMYPDIPLPMQLRRNLKRKIESFDTFKLSKGLARNKTVSLKDAFCLLRPKPSNKDLEATYKSIMEGKLSLGAGKAQIRTELSSIGKSEDKDNTNLKEAVYNGTLQNIVYSLRSLYDNGVFEDLKLLNHVCKRLRNKKEVLNSKLLPFRFFSAYRELNSRRSNVITVLCESLADAVDISVDSVDNLSGNTAVLVDLSGSMEYAISEKSSVTALDIACLLGAIAYKKGFGDLFVFGNQCERITLSAKTPILDLVTVMKGIQSRIGCGTDLNKALKYITKFSKTNDLSYDNLIILSDGDCYEYDKSANRLIIGENNWWCGNSREGVDSQINSMIGDAVVKKVWLNNLLGNNFSLADTSNHTKNLVTGFSEKFLNMIDLYNSIGGTKDIRKVIDGLLKCE